MLDQKETNEADDQAIVDDSETATVPVEDGPWNDEDFFLNYQY
jgi:hypothetical protein